MATTTMHVGEELLRKARSYVGPMDVDALARLAFTTLIQLKAGEWLAAQGGTQPDLPDIPRRRWSEV